MTVRKGKKAVTLRDVAETVGYSINTVSHALRDKDDISEDTREKIKQTAAQLGYITNAQASSLRLGYTKTIAVILGDISNPHFAIITKEIEEKAGQLGYSTFFISTGEDEGKELKAIQTALNKNVDGIIICPTQKSSGNIRYLKSSGLPFVLIGRRFEDIDTDYVVCDDELGGYQATMCLLRHGHRDILMLNGPAYVSSAKDRYAGYCRALKEYGIALRPELVLEAEMTCGRNQALLKKAEECGISYSAIFAFSDLLAWEAWSYQIKCGRRVPEDCSIIGFDYISSRMVLPFELSSISSHKYKMSASAVELLLEKINGSTKCSHIVIDTKLVPGATVAAI